MSQSVDELIADLRVMAGHKRGIKFGHLHSPPQLSTELAQLRAAVQTLAKLIAARPGVPVGELQKPPPSKVRFTITEWDTKGRIKSFEADQ